jgi:hypothetical protein
MGNLILLHVRAFFFFFMGALCLVGGSLPCVCGSFPSPLLLCQFWPLFLLLPTFLVQLFWLVVKLSSFLPLVASVGPNLMSRALNVVSFFKRSMFCHSSGIVKLFMLFFLEILLALQLPLPLFPFMWLGC